jgi:hypothetical protein
MIIGINSVEFEMLFSFNGTHVEKITIIGRILHQDESTVTVEYNEPPDGEKAIKVFSK